MMTTLLATGIHRWVSLCSRAGEKNLRAELELAVQLLGADDDLALSAPGQVDLGVRGAGGHDEHVGLLRPHHLGRDRGLRWTVTPSFFELRLAGSA